MLGLVCQLREYLSLDQSTVKRKKADPLSDMQVRSELSFHFELDGSKTQIKRVIP